MLQSLDLASIQTLGIPGISIATIREGYLADVRHIGLRSTQTMEPVDADTVFEAASLSKPVMAYAVLRLVDSGKIDLDEPLASIVPAVIPNDPGAAVITARHVLTHTTGLPNWRREEYPLQIYFPPGSRFSYSGEGFSYLQGAVEHLTGKPLDNLMRELVFEPLAMERSTYVWREGLEANFATAHDDKGNAYDKFRPKVANAAYSLHTTAGEYGRFLMATMGNSGLSKSFHEDWLAPQVHVPIGRFEALESSPPETDPGVAWSLGWGIEIETGTVFHWGANLGASAFVVVNAQSALVLFANSNAGLGLIPRLLDEFLPGSHPALSWLGLS